MKKGNHNVVNKNTGGNMKEEYRTTIIFDKDMRRKIKLYQVDHDDSMKTIIYEALNHFFDNEVKKIGKK